MLKVLRLKEGDTFPIIDKRGYKGKAIITSIINTSYLEFRILELEGYNPEFPFHITLAQSLIKGKNMSILLKKATELGVSKIVPIISERTVVRKINVDRWKNIVKEASKQSLRLHIPYIEDLKKFEEVIQFLKEYPVKIILSPHSDLHIREFLENTIFPYEIVFLSGPEGGFTKKEINLAKKYGFTDINLGKRILRAETAPLVFLSILEYKWGNVKSSI